VESLALLVNCFHAGSLPGSLLKTEVVTDIFSRNTGYFQWTTRRYIPEDSVLQLILMFVSRFPRKSFAKGARSSIVVKALCYKPEGNRTRPCGSLSL
jgi:hypothetical protein